MNSVHYCDGEPGHSQDATQGLFQPGPGRTPTSTSMSASPSSPKHPADTGAKTSSTGSSKPANTAQIYASTPSRARRFPRPPRTWPLRRACTATWKRRRRRHHLHPRPSRGPRSGRVRVQQPPAESHRRVHCGGRHGCAGAAAFASGRLAAVRA